MAEAPDFIPLDATPPKSKVPNFIPLSDLRPTNAPAAVQTAPGYLPHAVETLKAAGEAIVTSPKQAALGAGKAVASGALSLADLAAQGLYGIASSKTFGGYSQEGAE